jgi:CRISPR-associated protein Cas2
MGPALAGPNAPAVARKFANRPAHPEMAHGASMARSLYLVAYDISCPRRLRRTLKAVKAWRAAGQKSVAECFMSPAERNGLLAELESIIVRQEDRLHCLRLDPRMATHLFGIASPARSGPFIIG